MGTKVPSERASCPQGMHCGAGEMGTDASWISMENDQRCCAVCGESRMHGAQRGDEETYRKATRLVPTQRECGNILTPLRFVQNEIAHCSITSNRFAKPIKK